METKKLLNQLGLVEYIAFDFETTGLNPNEDRIIEIAAIKFLNGKPVDRFVTLVNPERPIDPFITDITGISDKMVKVPLVGTSKASLDQYKLRTYLIFYL